jgi:hypothetical protein
MTREKKGRYEEPPFLKRKKLSSYGKPGGLSLGGII